MDKFDTSERKPDGSLRHAIITGNIDGRVSHDGDLVNVTPPVLYTDELGDAQALMGSIEAEHAARGTHPVQQECDVLNAHRDEFSDDTVKAHQAAHKALNKKAGL